MDAKEQKLIEACVEASRNCVEADLDRVETCLKRDEADIKRAETFRKLREYRKSKAQRGGKAGG